MATKDNLSNSPNPRLDGVTGREPTPEEVARRDGYVQGRSDENYVQGSVRSQERAVAQTRANDSAASGMVLGLFLALLAAGVGAAIYFLTGDRTSVEPVVVPQIERETTIERDTTVIERESPAPAVELPDVNVPDVNIQVPDVDVPDVDVTDETAAPAENAEEASEPASE